MLKKTCYMLISGIHAQDTLLWLTMPPIVRPVKPCPLTLAFLAGLWGRAWGTYCTLCFLGLQKTWCRAFWLTGWTMGFSVTPQLPWIAGSGAFPWKCIKSFDGRGCLNPKILYSVFPILKMVLNFNFVWEACPGS
jgi:hypothetical protein